MSDRATLDQLSSRIRAGDDCAAPEILDAVMPLLWAACHEVGAAFGEDPRNLISASALAAEKSVPYLKKTTVGMWLHYLKRIARAAAIREARSNAPGRSLSGPSTKIGSCQSLDAEITHEDGEGSTLHDLIPSQTPEARNYEHLHRSLSRLKPNHRKVVELHFGFDGRGARTQAESARELGTTRQNVSLHIAAAMKKLRSLLAEEIAMLSGLRAIACAALVLLLSAPSARALTYAEWIAGYPALTGSSAMETADPDGDGFNNLLEFALSGGDPTVPNGPAMATKLYLQTRNADGSYNAPALKISNAERAAAASIHGVIRYQPREGVAGIRFVPMTNQENLKDWGWGPSAFIEWTDSGYSYARSIADMRVWKGRSFLRIKVEAIP